MAVVAVAVLAVSTVVLLPPSSVLAQTPTEGAAIDQPTDDATAAGAPAQTQAGTDGSCVTNTDVWGTPVSGTCTYGPMGSAYQFFRPPAEVGRFAWQG